MLDAQSSLFPSDHVYETSRNHQPRRQFTWLLTSFVFSMEALSIFGTGFLLQKLTSAQSGIIQPLELSFAYCFLVVLMDGVAVSSSERRSRTALRAVTAVFICSFAIHASLILTSAWGAATLATWLAGAAASVTILGNGARDIMQRLPAAWPLPSRALVFGNGSWALNFARDNRLAGARAAFDVVGIVDEPDGSMPSRDGLSGLARRVVAEKVTDVFVALPMSAADRIRDILAALWFLPVTVRLAPEHLPLLRIPGVDVVAVKSMPVLSRPPFSQAGLSIKRGMDVAGAISLIVLLLPLFAVIAILIKIDSPGPVLFRQTRTGQFGSSFSMYKFRSLYVEQADHAADRLVGAGDTRVTRVGRYARKYSLDELPQLLNVAGGSMSLVGPRPHASRAKAGGRLYAEVRPDYPLRYRVKPGMTGWAQVDGWRGNTDTAEKLMKRVEFDLDYIRSWSLALDLQILLRTIPSIIAPPLDNA